MGQDGEDRKSEDPDVAIDRATPGRLEEFRAQARDAARYERGLAWKAAVVLVAVAVIVIIRELFLS